MEGEKRPPHAQLLSGETRASACQPSTTQAHTVAFSVPEHPGAEVVHKTHSPIKTPVLYPRLFSSYLLPVNRSSHLKVRMGLYVLN